jgi:regulator of protease activity HflC (stomatin/prohibitin superfamily)
MNRIEKEHKNNFPIMGFFIGCSAIFLGILILGLLVLGFVARSLFITIGPEEVAVVISPYEPGGYVKTPLTPGNHFVRPLEQVVVIKTSRQDYSSTSTDCNCGSADSRSVDIRTTDDVDIIIDYQLTYIINAKQAVKLYHTWQNRYQDEFVIPQSKKITQEIASKYTSNEIALTKRGEIEKAIFSSLEPDFAEAYLVLLEFKIIDVRLKD